MPKVEPGEIRIVVIVVQGKAEEATASAVQQIKALFLAPNGVVCTNPKDAATATGD